jgi:TRAP-type transport system periplasmic protein
MKPRVSLFVAIVIMFLASSFCLISSSSTAEAQVMTLKFSHQMAETHPNHLAAKMFASRVEERTKGQIKINIFPASALGSPPELAEQVRLGTVDITTANQGTLDKYIRAISVVLLPYVFDDLDHAHRVIDGPSWDWFSQLAEKEGFIFLSNWELGMRHITNSKRPILKPEDVSGLKIRVPPEIQILATIEALGAVGTKIAVQEVYMALAQGVVDGQENPIQFIFHNKWYEVNKYIALTNHGYSNLIHVISTKTWAKLTPEQQNIIREESKSAGAYVRKISRESDDDLITKMEKMGATITRPELAPFRKLMGPATERCVKYSGEDNVKRFMKLVEDARKK